jgi:hypothetical protein
VMDFVVGETTTLLGWVNVLFSEFTNAQTNKPTNRMSIRTPCYIQKPWQNEDNEKRAKVMMTFELLLSPSNIRLVHTGS